MDLPGIEKMTEKESAHPSQRQLDKLTRYDQSLPVCGNASKLLKLCVCLWERFGTTQALGLSVRTLQNYSSFVPVCVNASKQLKLCVCLWEYFGTTQALRLLVGTLLNNSIF